jgi:hypothetical protein
MKEKEEKKGRKRGKKRETERQRLKQIWTNTDRLARQTGGAETDRQT